MSRTSSMRLVANNVNTQRLVATRLTVASSVVERGVGLLTRSGLAPGEGLLITPCRGVHTWGMRFAIDLVALDRDGIVVDAVAAMPPWRIRLPRRGACSVLELPAGSLAQSNTALGHRIALELMPQEAAR